MQTPSKRSYLVPILLAVVAVLALALILIFAFALRGANQQAAQASATPLPTNTSTPVSTETLAPTATAKPNVFPTHRPTAKPSPTADAAEVRSKFYQLTAKYVGQVAGVDKVNTVRGKNGMLEIEVQASFTDHDILTSISYDIIQQLALATASLSEADMARLCDGDTFAVSLTVINLTGDEKAISLTPYAAYAQVGTLAITQSEWAAAAGLKFGK